MCPFSSDMFRHVICLVNVAFIHLVKVKRNNVRSLFTSPPCGHK